MPELEHNSKISHEKRIEIQLKFDKEDLRVRDITEKLRQERDEIDKPLLGMQGLARNIKMQIECRKSEIEQLRSKKDKIAGEREQLTNMANM